MRTLIVTELATLDGVMETPSGEPSHPTPAGSWTTRTATDANRNMRGSSTTQVAELLEQAGPRAFALAGGVTVLKTPW
jgi:hypothetical protein